MDEPMRSGSEPLPVAPTRGWVKIVLALSLAVNLGIGGLLAGNYFSPAPRAAGRHDIGLGPLAEALQREDWRAMRPSFIAKNPELRRGREALRADFDPVLNALRATPFAPEALQSALREVSDRNTDRLTSAREVIADYLVTLSPEARLEYAARLEAALAKGRNPRKD